MFKKVSKSVISSLVLFSSLLAASPGSWMPTAKKISSIIVEGGDNGIALIIIEGGVPVEYLPESCRSGGARIYNTIHLNTDKGKGMYSLALAAYAAGKPVKLVLACTGNRPLITHMWIL